MKVVFINLYPSDNQRYQLSAYVLKGYLEEYCINKDQLNIEVLNYSVNSDLSDISNRAIDIDADLLCFSCYVWNINEVIYILEQIKSQIRSKVLLGGPEISIKWISTLKDPLISDYYAIGLGERILCNLLNYLTVNLSTVPNGIAYIDNNLLIYRESNEVITNLDEIPSIYLNKVINDELIEKQEAYIETQRGCKYHCKYCVYHKNLDKIYYYSLDRVYQELEYLIKDKQILSLRIFDSIFTHNLERAKSIVKYLISMKDEDVELPYLIYWELMYIGIDEEFFQLTSQLKTRKNILNTYMPYHTDYPQHYSSLLEDYTVINCIGIQSFNSNALKSVHRVGIDTEKFNNFMSNARKYNIVLKVDLILGLPFETLESYINGLNYIIPFFEETDHILNIHKLQILPGSEMEELCKTHNMSYHLEAPHYVYKTEEFTEDDLTVASKLSAVLFRILNSTLRPYLFQASRKTNAQYMEIIEDIYKNIEKCDDLLSIELLGKDINDGYWNDQIFHDLPSKWLIEYFNKL